MLVHDISFYILNWTKKNEILILLNLFLAISQLNDFHLGKYIIEIRCFNFLLFKFHVYIRYFLFLKK
jgi:hypothetical protein